jgi:hypothetical protein
MLILFRFEHGDLLIGRFLSFDAEIAHGSIELFFGKIFGLLARMLFDLLHLALSQLGCTGPNGENHCTGNDHSSAHSSAHPAVPP